MQQRVINTLYCRRSRLVFNNGVQYPVLRRRSVSVRILIGIALGLSFINLAQAEEPDRAKAALPALVDQRNTALDAAALCQGDIVILKQQLSAMQAELDKLKAEPPKK